MKERNINGIGPCYTNAINTSKTLLFELFVLLEPLLELLLELGHVTWTPAAKTLLFGLFFINPIRK